MSVRARAIVGAVTVTLALLVALLVPRLVALLRDPLNIVQPQAMALPAPVATPRPSTPPADPRPTRFVRHHDAAAGISYDVPLGWAIDPDDTVWRPAPGSPRALGVRTLVAGPGADARSLLPPRSMVVAEDRLDLGWGAGTRYRLTNPDGAGGPLRETHVVVTLPSKRVLDLFVSAPVVEDQGALLTALDRLLTSVTVEQPPGAR